MKRGAEFARVLGMLYLMPAWILAEKTGAVNVGGFVLIDLREPGAVEAMKKFVKKIED